MAKKERDKIMLAEHIVEVRHEASGTFLDVRGYVADYIRDKKIFPHWQIDSNIINFRDIPDGVKKEAAFVGFKSAGYIVYNPDTKNYFPDKASAFWKALQENGHYKIPAPTRLGVRTKIFIPTNQKFDEISKLLFEVFYTEKAKKLLGGKEKDVQLAVDLDEGQFEVHFRCGPMHENEIEKHLNFESEHFSKCGLFIDLDYYKTTKLSHKDIPKLMKEAVAFSWEKAEKIATELGI
ncbi:MAG: hypothetical protein AB1461_04645 [Thermodesulfobacteriota bacterium]